MMGRHLQNKIFSSFAKTILYSLSILLMVILGYLVSKGLGHMDMAFFENFASRHPEKAGIKAALIGTVYLVALTLMISIPVGVGTALYFEEFMPKSKLKTALELNIANLAAVPSIIYGVLGLGFFVRFLMWERSLMAGAATLSLLIMPVIIIAARSAIAEVPRSIKEAAFALGATKERVVWQHVLPNALPGIFSGIVFSMGRAIGESAPLIMVGALSFVAYTPESVWDSYTVLPVQIFNWASRPQEEFQNVAASAIIVLLALVILFVGITSVLRERYSKKREGF